MAFAAELEQRLEAQLIYTKLGVGTAAVIEDEPHPRRAQCSRRLVQLIALALDLHQPSHLTRPCQQASRRRLLDPRRAVGDQIDAKADRAAVVEGGQRTLVDVGRNPRDALEPALALADGREHAAVI